MLSYLVSNNTWEVYKQGFGNVTGEFWLGNEAIHLISTNGKHKLHIGLELRNGSRFYADYFLFKVNNESSQYLLNVTGYSGTADDAMDNVHSAYRANGAPFSTSDRVNNKNTCVKAFGGWWYVGCSISNLNGAYVHGEMGRLLCLRMLVGTRVSP
ncbi:techylectin-5B-like [Mytilus galloprovincialis]|uniref:techylectin-5B-like n=1 Tax=Mytilus galloprovincialis TaxID=29158 RepID=UPI003F7B9FEA